MVDIAVVDPLPLFRAGAAAALATASNRVGQPTDVLAWARNHPDSVVVLTLDSEPAWSLLATLHSRHGAVSVVALTVDASPIVGARAVQTGARCVLGRSATPETLRQAVDAAARGIAMLPADALGYLGAAGGSAQPSTSRPISEEQLSWLRELATGRTVTGLATAAGYSERAMYRLLRGLYEQLGARGRTEALIRAQSLGLIGPP